MLKGQKINWPYGFSPGGRLEGGWKRSKNRNVLIRRDMLGLGRKLLHGKPPGSHKDDHT